MTIDVTQPEKHDSQSPPPRDSISTEERETCLRVLRTLSQQPERFLIPGSDLTDIQRAAAGLSKAIKRHLKSESAARDNEVLQQTGLRRTRRERRSETEPLRAIGVAETEPTSVVRLTSNRHCYICKGDSEHVHSFYDMMCPACGELNFAKRSQTTDLAGRTALVTGGRVKIGFQMGLKLLRAGAELIVTTRFPIDAAHRYSQEPSFDEWRDRLRIFGVDFRHWPGLERFTQQVADDYTSLDVLINNSAQTIRRPPVFFEHIWEKEQRLLTELDMSVRETLANLSDFTDLQTLIRDTEPTPGTGSVELPSLGRISTVDRADFPVGRLDEHGQQVDLRSSNSWVAKVPDVRPLELLEVHAINTFAPFFILQQLEPLLMAREDIDRFVVNVSAMEGRFDHFKDGRHPHTNMAKAGLNMLTRTCAEDYAKRRLFVNSVDTGWITNEFPHAKVSAMQNEGFEPPLDEIDGAARVLDPIFTALNGHEPVFGKFLKDYREITW